MKMKMKMKKILWAEMEIIPSIHEVIWSPKNSTFMHGLEFANFSEINWLAGLALACWCSPPFPLTGSFFLFSSLFYSNMKPTSVQAPVATSRKFVFCEFSFKWRTKYFIWKLLLTFDTLVNVFRYFCHLLRVGNNLW